MSNKKLAAMPKNLMFSLDIGTRSVVGVISRKEDKKYVVLDHEVMEHPDRAMFDGQIHDIEKVAEVVRVVVDNLQNRNGYKLEQVAIAAAGRALKTERALYEQEIDLTKEVNKEIMDGVEMQAIQKAQKRIAEEIGVHSEYYCVGYSVINYYLDHAMILNPVGHRGGLLGVDIIATFLPHVVVDSLYSVMSKVGLEVMNLTLEPIASINVAIPKNLRLLNLALVDVGAGTSDIAISKDGAVVSYGMVALAGDEITEKIAQTYLLDFNHAEKLKLNLEKSHENQFTDILGLEHHLSTASILTEIEDVIAKITSEVAKNILELNKKPPSAVFCIGGGSRIPEFTAHLAKELGLPPERVVIKSVETLEMVEFTCDPLCGPEFITPVGIGVTAFEERDHDFIQVTVNDTAIRLFNSKPLQVSDALILTGFNARNLISERGESYFIQIDGIQKEIKGEYGDSAQIYVNGAPAHLDSRIAHKDIIVVVAAEKGKSRKMTLKEVVNLNSSVTLNDHEIKLVEFVSVNGINRTGDYLIIDGDVIVTKGIKTAGELLQAVELDTFDYSLYCGEKQLEESEQLKSGQHYTYKKVKKTVQYDHYREDSIKKAHIQDSTSDRHEFNVERGDNSNVESDMSYIGITVNGNSLKLPLTKKELVFVDVFEHFEFDLTKPKGILVLKLNGERARYTDCLKNGDIIDIYWNN